MELEELQPLVGEWAVEATVPGQDGTAAGRTTWDWLERGGYLIQRTVMENPVFPACVMVIGPDAAGERLVQHYFDSRGVARIYDVSLVDGILRLWRDGPDFAQRYSGRLSDDGAEITGAWERCDDDGNWVHDFDLTQRRIA